MPSQKLSKSSTSIFDRYCKTHTYKEISFKLPPSPKLGMVVVIPVYNEPDLQETLCSLLETANSYGDIEVICVVNQGAQSSHKVKTQNEDTIKVIESFARKHDTLKKRFFYCLHEEVNEKHQGVGLARKIGMDYAIKRFQEIENEEGIIISLDADCKVAENYFQAIELFYARNNKEDGCNIYFEHMPLEDGCPGVEYELYLRYYTEALRYIDFPFPFHTIGSCFAIRAKSYCDVGGMNRRQAGEDFYFLQKVFLRNKFQELNQTIVYPSSRLSDRAPFGTGPTLKSLGNDSLKVYSLEGFLTIRKFYSLCFEYFMEPDELLWGKLLEALPKVYTDFLERFGFKTKYQDCLKNAGSQDSFKTRFYSHFNNFFVVKSLNALHRRLLLKEDVKEVISTMIYHWEKEDVGNLSAIELLDYMRARQKR